MRQLVVAATLGATLAITTGELSHDPDWKLDLNRGPRYFALPTPRQSGFTYQDEFAMEGTAGITDFALPQEARFALVAETHMAVLDIPGLGTTVQVGLVQVKGYIDSPVMQVICESYRQETMTNPDCWNILKLVGFTETIVVDKKGLPRNIMLQDGQVVGLESYPLAKAAMPLLVESQHLFHMIPSNAVQPGDSWTVHIDKGALGSLRGKSSLDGYTSIQGVKCAVFSFQGTLHLDISLLAKTIGYDIDKSPLPNHMSDATVTKTIVWDYNDNIARLTRVRISTNFTIGNTVHIPFDALLTLATDVTSRPGISDQRDTPNKLESLLGAALANNGRFNGRATNRFSATAAIVGLFGVLAITGLLLHRNPRYAQYQQLA